MTVIYLSVVVVFRVAPSAHSKNESYRTGVKWQWFIFGIVRGRKQLVNLYVEVKNQCARGKHVCVQYCMVELLCSPSKLFLSQV